MYEYKLNNDVVASKQAYDHKTHLHYELIGQL